MVECLTNQQSQHQYRMQKQPVSVHSVERQTNRTENAEAMQCHMGHYFQQQRQASLVQCPTRDLQQQQQPHQLGRVHQPTGNELIGYYFGSISRETAEWILREHGGHKNGSFLLRSSGPNDDFVLSLLVIGELHRAPSIKQANEQNGCSPVQELGGLASNAEEVLHYKIIETEDSFVALHGQVGNEKFATIDELIDKAQGVATKPRWPIQRQLLESQILPPTYWGLTVDQIRLAILLIAKQWGFPMFSSLFRQPPNSSGLPAMDHSMAMQMLDSSVSGNHESSMINNVNTLNNETIRTLIYKSLHEFQPWFHGKIQREEAEHRIELGPQRDGRFLVRERDNFSYAMCISHKKTTKHYRIDVLPTGELAIQDGHKFTSLMALVSHYTLMSDGLWCALTEACPRPIKNLAQQEIFEAQNLNSRPQLAGNQHNSNKIYCAIPAASSHLCNNRVNNANQYSSKKQTADDLATKQLQQTAGSTHQCSSHGPLAMSLKLPLKDWLQTVNQKWSQFMVAKNQQSLNSFLFGSSNPLNNHCRHGNRRNQRNHHHHHHHRANGNCRQQNTRSSVKKQAPAEKQPTSCCSCTTHYIAHSIDGDPQRQRTELAQANQYMPPCTCVAMDEKYPNRTECYGQNLHRASQTRAGVQCAAQALPLSFSLSGQTFVGSPLFAVRAQKAPLQAQTSHQLELEKNGGNGNGSGSDSGHNAPREDKLISPAQSISAQMNVNPYTMDLYGSQSTAIVHDRSSSSSSGNRGSALASARNPQGPQQVASLNFNGLHYSAEGANHLNQSHPQIFQAAPSAFPPPPPPPPPPQDCNVANNSQPMPTRPSFQPAGRIVCGQHAGPAYRYTNTDDGPSRQCLHLRHLDRSLDDTHLQTQSTQLANRAAMSKFVQFQDGHCLRTHRDTKSIQMAYMQSKRQIQQMANIRDHQFQGAAPMPRGQPSGFSQDRMPFAPAHSAAFSQQTTNVAASANNARGEIDLIDCESDAFNFNYDPKLIKSSSIETLCGGADEENTDFLDELGELKSNSQLLMSLQSFWQDDKSNNETILRPIPAAVLSQSLANELCLDSNNTQSHIQLTQAAPASSMLTEELYSMKKTHDLDELTTNLLEELTTSLKAQIDLKKKRSGLVDCSAEPTRQDNDTCQRQQQQQTNKASATDLLREFDTLKR